MLTLQNTSPTNAWGGHLNGASRVLAWLPQPMLVLQPDRRLEFQNASAEALFRQQLATVRSNHLMKLGQLDTTRLDDLLRLAAAGSTLRVGLWFSPHLSTGWLHTAPLPVEWGPVTGCSSDAILLTIHLDQPALTQAARVDALTRQNRLSPAERHVLLLLGDGLTVELAAQSLGLKLSTLRSHVRSLLTKTQASSLMQLLRWVGSATDLPH